MEVWRNLTVPPTGEAKRPRPLLRARPPHPLRPAVWPGPLLLPDHREQLQTHRRQDPPARAEPGHGERADGQAAVAVGLGQLNAPQEPTGGLQSSREHGHPAVLQREEGATEPAAEAAAASAARTSPGGPGQAEAATGPEEESQPPQSPPRGLTQRAPSFSPFYHSHLKPRRAARWTYSKTRSLHEAPATRRLWQTLICTQTNTQVSDKLRWRRYEWHQWPAISADVAYDDTPWHALTVLS